MPFEKGHKKQGGKKKGSTNKFTDLKEAFLEAFEKLEGAKGLVAFAKSGSQNKRAFYQMIAKMLPANVLIDPDSEMTIRIIEKVINENGGDISNGVKKDK